MAKSRASEGFMVEPARRPTHSPQHREQWLQAAKDGFVCPPLANRTIYGLILEYLWPSNYDIPGPIVTQDGLRQHVDAERAARGNGPYKDIFRRVLELQGEEGFTSIRKEGVRDQRQSLDMTAKRPPLAPPPRDV